MSYIISYAKLFLYEFAVHDIKNANFGAQGEQLYFDVLWVGFVCIFLKVFFNCHVQSVSVFLFMGYISSVIGITGKECFTFTLELMIPENLGLLDE